jgi:hypothetical protein
MLVGGRERGTTSLARVSNGTCKEEGERKLGIWEQRRDRTRGREKLGFRVDTVA